jgi:uncharacterized membrane protein
MVPFGVLFVVFGALHLIARLGLVPASLRSGRARMRVALASMFVLTGVSHFTATDAFVAMVPEFLPLRREAIHLSGLAELAGAAGLLVPRLRRLAGLGLAALLVSVFPANVNVALNGLVLDEAVSSPGGAAWQWARLALQPVLIWLALWASAEPQPAPATPADEPSRAPTTASA